MQKSKSFPASVGCFVVRYRWWILIFTIIAAMAASMGGEKLVFNHDNRAFFDKDNPELLAFEHLEDTFNGRDENVFIAIGPKSGKVFSRESLEVIEKYTNLAWNIPYSTRVDSITNFQHSYADGDDLVIKDLVKNAASLDEQQITTIRQTALAEPLLVKRVVSEDGRVAGINVTIQFPGIRSDLEEPKVVDYARKLVAQLRHEHPDYEVHLTGIVMLNTAFGEASANDMQVLMPLTLLMFLVCIGLLMRGWTSPFSMLLVITFSIMSAMGMAGWLHIDLTSISASAPTIILALTIANGIHVLVTFVNLMRDGVDKANAMQESIRINLQPIFLVSMTTVLGFLSMNFSESPVFHDLGNIVAIGVAISFILCITFLPALMMILPMKKPKPKKKTNSAMEKFAGFVIRYQNQLLISIGGLALVLVLFVSNNEMNDEWIKYFDQSMEFRQDTDYTTKNITGFYRIDYALNSSGSNGIGEPNYLKKVQAFTKWYRAQPEVIQVTAITDILARLNKNMHGDDPAYDRIADSKALNDQYLLLYEMSLPYGLDLNNLMDVDKSATRVTATIKALPVKQTLALEDRAQAWLAKHAPEMRSEGTGNTIMFAHIGLRNIKSMLIGSGLALILISAILIFAFRSLKLGLVSLLPNIIPGLMGFGLWGILVGQIGMGLATVAGVTLGIVVDDTIHFLSKYLRAKREKNMQSEDAIRYAFSTVGTALWFSSFTLIIGFSVLAFSTFKMNGDMGLLTAVTIGFALLADFLFLPSLLLKLDRESTVVTDKVVDETQTNNPALASYQASK